MGEEKFAANIGQPVIIARELLHLHRETYRQFWRWSDQAADHVNLAGHLDTVFGWRLYTKPDYNDRTIRNFPMQADGAEMMRVACCLATERGIEVCSPVHDAFLIAAPVDRMLLTDLAALGLVQPKQPRYQGEPNEACQVEQH
jgi:hypothetical protein